MKDKERISFEIPAQTYRVLRQMMVDLDLKTVADVVRLLMEESPKIKAYVKANNAELDFGSGQWGGRRLRNEE